MIEGVRITPLRQIADDRGKVMHMLRATDPQFAGFGEVYFSTVHRGAVKAWKRHREMTLNLACIAGEVRLVVLDDRETSPTCGAVQEIFLSPENYALATIPPMLWTGFTGIADGDSMLCNCASLPHDPAESDRRAADDPPIPFRWEAAP